jgi:uncharacterized protein YoxC
MKPIYEIIGDGCFTDGTCHHPKDDYPYTLGRKVLYQQQVIINQGNIICLGDYSNEVIIVEATETEYFFNFAKMPNRKYIVIFRALEATTIKFPRHIIFNGELKSTSIDIKVRKDEELVIEVLCAKESGKSLVLVNINGYDSYGRILDDKTITDLKDAVDELENKVEEIDTVVDEIGDTFGNITGLGDLSSLVDQINDLTDIVENNTDAIEGVGNRLDAVSGLLGNGTGSVDLTALENKVDAVSGKLELVSGGSGGGTTDLTAVNQRIDDISGKLETIGTFEGEDLSDVISEISGKLESIGNFEGSNVTEVITNISGDITNIWEEINNIAGFDPTEINNRIDAISGVLNPYQENIKIVDNQTTSTKDIIIGISGSGATFYITKAGLYFNSIDDDHKVVIGSLDDDDGEW